MAAKNNNKYIMIGAAVLVIIVIIALAFSYASPGAKTTTVTAQNASGNTTTTQQTTTVMANATNATLASLPMPLIKLPDAMLLLGVNGSYNVSLLNNQTQAADALATTYSPTNSSFSLFKAFTPAIRANVSGGWALSFKNSTKGVSLWEVIVNTKQPLAIYNQSLLMVASEAKRMSNLTNFGGSNYPVTYYMIYNGTAGNLRVTYFTGYTSSKAVSLVLTTNRSTNVSVDNKILVSVVNKDIT